MNTDIAFERLDQKIKNASQSSAKAPAAFLEAELRRWLNSFITVYTKKTTPRSDRELDFSNHELEGLREKLEADYQCYFEPEKFAESVRPSSWWKFTYAGCNAEIEHFLLENGLEEAAETLWSARLPAGIQQWEEKEFFKGLHGSPRDNLRRYFIGIGYLYPQPDGNVKVHPNLLFGQQATETTYATMDSPFLTRDLIRCPYHEAEGWKKPLSDAELWKYWQDLLALSLAGLPEHILYLSENFRGEDNYQSEIIVPTLKLGRTFVPQRYVELEPHIEKFEWHLPAVSK